MFQNRLLRKIFGPQRDEVINEEDLLIQILRSALLTEYYLDDGTKRNEMGVTCGSCVGDERCVKT